MEPYSDLSLRKQPKPTSQASGSQQGSSIYDQGTSIILLSAFSLMVSILYIKKGMHSTIFVWLNRSNFILYGRLLL